MKRRVFLASSVMGIASLSGCMGLFSDNDNEDENNGEETEPNEDIELPHSELEPDAIPSSFVEGHFTTLSEAGNYTVTYETQTNKGNPKEIEWKRIEGKGKSTVTVNSEVVEERYYSGSLLGIRSPSENTVNVLERPLEPVSEWANASFIRETIDGGTFSVDSETDSEVVYAGVLTSVETSTGVQVHISKNRPIITQIQISEENKTYEVSGVGSTEVVEPEWFTEAKNNNVIVTGGVYQDGDALIIKVNETSQPIPEGSLMNVIPPNGESGTVQIEEEVSAGESVYIIFRDGVPTYSVGQLPDISGRDQLQDGTYIVIGTSPDGDQQFELQLIADSSSS